MKDTVGLAEQTDSCGRRATFEVSVKFRQNSTWQGQIFWAEKNMKQNFRSALEMIRLMDQAVSDGSEGKPVWARKV